MKPHRWFDLPLYLAVRGFVEIVGFLPRFIAYPLCRGLAGLVYLADAKHRRIGMINLKIAFPGSDERWRRHVLLESYRQQGHHTVELSRLNRQEASEIRSRVSYEPGRGLENYLEAKNRTGSVIFLTAHVSCWELLPAAHALAGYPLGFVVRPLDNPYLESWVTRIRSWPGNQVLPKRHSMRSILRGLSQGSDVGLLIDQNTQRKDGVFVPLFGRLASTHAGVAVLALRTSHPVVPGFIYPGRRRGYYRIRFYPAVALVRTGNDEEDARTNTARFNRYIEEMVREFPHCWLWGHRRFHTGNGGADPYSESGDRAASRPAETRAGCPGNGV